MPYTPLDVQGSIFQLDAMGKEIGKMASLGERSQALLGSMIETRSRQKDIMVIDLEEIANPEIVKSKEDDEESEGQSAGHRSEYAEGEEEEMFKTEEKAEYGKGNLIEIIA